MNVYRIDYDYTVSKKFDLSVTKISIAILEMIPAAELESEVCFALLCQNFELFIPSSIA